MKEIDFGKLKVSSQYKFGMHLSNGAERQHEHTIIYPDHPLDGQKYRSSTWTSKRGHNWGKPKTEYFFTDKKGKEHVFDNPMKCVEALNETLIHVVK